MKKTLSVILALLMALSAVSYAAPLAVNSVETAAEAVPEGAQATEKLSEQTAALAAEQYNVPEGSKLVFTADFNDTTTDPRGADVGSIGTYNPDFTLTDVVKSTSAAKIVFNKNNSGTYECNTTGSDTDVSVKYTHNDDGRSWPIIRVTANNGYFADGRYTMCAEITVPEGDATDLKYTFIVNGTYEGNAKQATPNDNEKYSITGGGVKNYISIDILVYEGNVYSYGLVSGLITNTYDKNSIAQMGFLIDSTGEEKASASFVLDDYSMYYQPLSFDPKTHASVSFNSNGMTVTDLPEDLVVARNSFDLSQYKLKDVGTSRFVGWADSPNGSVITSVPSTPFITLYAIWDDNYYTDESILPQGSKLVFHAHINTASAAALKNVNVANVGYYGDDFNKNGSIPDIVKIADGTTDNNKIVFDSGSVKSVSKQDGEILVSTSGTKASETWPNFCIKTNDGYFANGLYTIVAEMYAEADKELDYIDYQPLAYAGTNYMPSKIRWLDLNGTSTGKKLVVSTIAVYDNVISWDAKNVAYTIPANSMNKMGFTFCVKAATTETTKTNISFDNFKLYYAPLETKPGTYTVNFDANGKTVSDLPSKQINLKTLNLSSYKLADVGTSRFVGWATAPDGKIVTGTLTLTKNTTLYAIWDDYFYAAANEAQNSGLVLNMHFDHFVDGKGASTLHYVAVRLLSSIQSDYESDSSAITLISGAESKDNFRLSIAHGYLGAYDKDNKGAPDKFTNDDDAVIIQQTGSTEMYPKLSVITEKGHFVDGVYTFVAELTPEENENIEKITYNSYAQVKYNNNGSTASKDVSGTKKTLPLGESTFATVTILVNDGVVYDADTLKANFTGLEDTTVKMGFNFNVVPKDNTTATVRIFADNFRMYYKPFNKPSTYSENSIRVSEPAGIRFKSSVNSLVRSNKNLVEYGYIVARKVTLDSLGVDVNDFTMENAAISEKNYVKGISKGIVDGKAVDKIYEEKNNETFFTAVVYNIPNNMYKDVIVVRPYVKTGEDVTYGDAMSRSIYEVAQKLDGNAEFQEAVNKILKGEPLN